MRFSVTAQVVSKMPGVSPGEPVDMRWVTLGTAPAAIAAIASLLDQTDQYTELRSVHIDLIPEVGEQPPWQD
jgi:hypothetical protein